MPTEYTTRSGQTVVVGAQLATGGSAEVFTIISRPDVVFKRFSRRTLAADPSLPDRLAAMLAMRPSQWREPESGHLTLAWPTDLVLGDGSFAGLLMPAADIDDTVELDRLVNPSDRRDATETVDWARGLSWRALVETAGNLALAVDVLHESDTVIGDINEGNIRVDRDARVALLDCDSMQVTDRATGKTFFCRVGRPELAAPELRQADLSTTKRQPSSDLFPLAIHLHQLLLEGRHPFRGVWNAASPEPSVADLARNGLWTSAGLPELSSQGSTIGINLLPPNVTALFRRAFEDGARNPDARPSALAWHTALHNLSANLNTCPTEPDHQYWSGHRSCPWCAHASLSSTRTQIPVYLSPPPQPPAPHPPHPTYPNRQPSRGGWRMRPWAWASALGLVALGIALVVAGPISIGRGDGPQKSDGPTGIVTSAPVSREPGEAGGWLLDGTGAEQSGQQNATASGGVTWTTGRSGGAARFDGTGALTTAGPVLTTDLSFSLATWVRITDVKDFRTAVSLTSTQKPIVALQYRPPENAFCVTAVPSDSSTAVRVRVCAKTPAPVGEWTHLVAVFDADAQKITLHVNGGATLGGESVEKPFTTPWRAVGPLAIGRGQHLGIPDDFWLGDIEEVRAFQRVVTVDELAKLLAP